MGQAFDIFQLFYFEKFTILIFTGNEKYICHNMVVSLEAYL